MTSPPIAATAGSAQHRRRRALRRRISQAALELFEERGFDAVTIEDIADAGDISQRTFFRYFSSKEAVLFLPEDERLEAFEATLAHRLDTETLPEALSGTFRDIAVLWESDRELFRRASKVIGERPGRWERSHVIQGRWAQSIIRLLASHLGRAEADPQVMVIGEIFASAFRVALRDWHAKDARGSLSTLLDSVLPIAEAAYEVSGLGSTVGHDTAGLRFESS